MVTCEKRGCNEELSVAEIDVRRANQFCRRHCEFMRNINTNYKNAGEKTRLEMVKLSECEDLRVAKATLSAVEKECKYREKYMNLLDNPDLTHKHYLERRQKLRGQLYGQIYHKRTCNICRCCISKTMEVRQKAYKFPVHCGSNTCIMNTSVLKSNGVTIF